VDDETFQAELARLLEEEIPKRRQAEAHAEIDSLLRQFELLGEEYSRQSAIYHDESMSHARKMRAIEEMTELLARKTEIALRLSKVPAENRRSHRGFKARFLNEEAQQALENLSAGE
jgi:hypothetical protein